MKYVKHFLILIVFVFLQLLIFVGDKDQSIVKILVVVILSLFVLHLSMRQSVYFKAYFLSPWNVLSEKFRVKKTIDIPKDLLFDKLLELMAESKLHLKYHNKDEMCIFAISSMTFWSWGENIYIDLYDGEADTTEIHFTSVSFFQLHSWGKNEENFRKFIDAIEESLTI